MIQVLSSHHCMIVYHKKGHIVMDHSSIRRKIKFVSSSYELSLSLSLSLYMFSSKIRNTFYETYFPHLSSVKRTFFDDTVIFYRLIFFLEAPNLFTWPRPMWPNVSCLQICVTSLSGLPGCCRMAFSKSFTFTFSIWRSFNSTYPKMHNTFNKLKSLLGWFLHEYTCMIMYEYINI